MNNITNDLLPLARPIIQLRPDPKNARKHPPSSLEAIRKSLRLYGQVKPVVALSSGTVIAGNGTLAAALAEGWDMLAVVSFEDESKARAFAIADNRTAELSEWDDPALAEALNALQQQGVDFSDVGFSMEDAIAAMGKIQTNVNIDVATDSDDDRPPGPTENMRSSHVRMVQLFLNADTQPVFLENVQKLAKRYSADNITDTVFEAVKRASEAK